MTLRDEERIPMQIVTVVLTILFAISGMASLYFDTEYSECKEGRFRRLRNACVGVCAFTLVLLFVKVVASISM